MKKMMVAGVAMLLMLVGCRKESDSVVSYAFLDNMAFAAADTSFAAKFDVLWKGLNANYALWDFEKENGLDWDAVYEQYYPKFAALDKQKGKVADKEVMALLEEVVAPLHDGHLVVVITNHTTGSKISASPSYLRLAKDTARQAEYELLEYFIPSLKFYQAKGDVLEYKEVSSNPIQSIIESATAYIKDKVKTLTDKDLVAAYNKAKETLDECGVLIEEDNIDEALQLYNMTVIRYEFLHIPGLVTIESKLADESIVMKYALFKGNIAYLSLKAYHLTPYLDKKFRDEDFPDPSEYTAALIQQVNDTWKAWFDAIQAHHKAGDLGGVVIDMRSNEGGYLSDFRYTVGALVPSGGYHYANARFKRGPGRYDYSPEMPQPMPTLETEHVTVTEPVVLLCNCATISMGEHTTWGVKDLPNGKVIGTRTWGGLCALDSNASYSDNYAGFVGIKGQTPVFAYVPLEVVMTKDGKILEGTGIIPDIELAFEHDKWNGGNGPDNQLDRALAFIRNKEQ